MPNATDLPLFPLENVVLFPGVQVPLHIFEPRYCQMTRAALDGGRCIGMVTVRPEFSGEMLGNPPVFPIGCAGEILHVEELEDGRFNLVLRGTHRFRIVAEDEPDGDRIHRVARVHALEDVFEEEDQERVGVLREETFEMMRELVRIAAPERVDSFEKQPFAQVDDATFVNAVAQSMDFAPSEKQGLLEADGVRERYERLSALMRFRLAELSSGGRPGSNVLQ
jgi:Lon protease-like protein